MAKKLVAALNLHERPKSQSGVANIVKAACDTGLGVRQGGYTVSFLDIKALGEPVTDPRNRIASMNDDVLFNLIRGTLVGRSGDEDDLKILERDLYFILDGMKHGPYRALFMYHFSFVTPQRGLF